MTIVFNGAKITLNKTKTSVVVRDKHGHFVGMRDIHTVLEALEEAFAEGYLNLELCEIENHNLPKQPEQQQLDFLVRLGKETRQ